MSRRKKPHNRPNPARPKIGRCPDCNALPVGLEVTHEQTCPLGLSADNVSSADHDWFAAHPDAQQRMRPITQPELAELRWVGLTDSEPNYVLLERLAPGVLKKTSLLLIKAPSHA